jgi:hypothetical protein
MLYRPSSFRKSAFALTTVAALAGASVFASNSAFATEPSNLPPACAAMKDTNERAGCLFDAINKDTAVMKANIKRLKAAGDAADKELKSVTQSEGCFDFLKKGRDDKKFTREAVLEAAGGKLTVENSCTVARKFGFGQRASVDSPRMQ